MLISNENRIEDILNNAFANEAVYGSAIFVHHMCSVEKSSVTLRYKKVIVVYSIHYGSSSFLPFQFPVIHMNDG